jgi:NPCBM/NEW2 domain
MGHHQRRKKSEFMFRTIVCTMIIAVLVWSNPNASAEDLFPNIPTPAEVRVKVGRLSVVIPSQPFGLGGFPDMPIAVLKQRPLTFLMVCGNDTYLWSGPDWAEAVPVEKVLSPGPPGSPDNHYTGISSVFHDTNRLVAFYHAEDKEGFGTFVGNGIQGAYMQVCVADSPLNKIQFTKLGPAITANQPKKPVQEPVVAWIVQGVADPSVCIAADSRYLLCMYYDLSNRLKRGTPICIARAPVNSGGAPGSWSKYYQGSFSEPGLGGHETPVITGWPRADTISPHLQYVKAWSRYVVFFSAGVYADYETHPPKAKESGVYMSTSTDAIEWTKPVKIQTTLHIFWNDRASLMHPFLMINRATETKITGHVMCRYTPRWPDNQGDLASTPIEITLDRKQPALSATSAESAWTYLVDLPRIEVSHQNGWWSDRGELLLGGLSGEPVDRKPLHFEGKQSTHGIYLHARPSGNVTIKYRLGKRFSAFRSQVVIPEMFPWQGNPSTPLVFKIQGDGRLLWQSRPMGQKGDNQACTLSVRGVDKLSLQIDCPGPENWGLGAWIEPQLSMQPKRR